VPMPSVLVPRVVAAPPAPQSMIVNVPGPSTPPPPPPVMNVPVPTPMVMPGQAPSYAPTPAALVPNPPAAETAVAANEAYVINIPNAKGTYTPVALKRSGTGFVGPQGEFYTEFPRVEQLKLMYGK